MSTQAPVDKRYLVTKGKLFLVLPPKLACQTCEREGQIHSSFSKCRGKKINKMRFHQLHSTAAFEKHRGLSSPHPTHTELPGWLGVSQAGGILPAHRRVSCLLPQHHFMGSSEQAGPGPPLCTNRRQGFDSLGLSGRGTEVATSSMNS